MVLKFFYIIFKNTFNLLTKNVYPSSKSSKHFFSLQLVCCLQHYVLGSCSTLHFALKTVKLFDILKDSLTFTHSQEGLQVSFL